MSSAFDNNLFVDSWGNPTSSIPDPPKTEGSDPSFFGGLFGATIKVNPDNSVTSRDPIFGEKTIPQNINLPDVFDAVLPDGIKNFAIKSAIFLTLFLFMALFVYGFSRGLGSRA